MMRMMTLVVLPSSFSVASFSIFAKLTLKNEEDGEHDGVQPQDDQGWWTWVILQEEDGEHGGVLLQEELGEHDAVLLQEEMEPGVVWHEKESIEKGHNGDARIEPDSAMETKPASYNVYQDARFLIWVKADF